MRRTIYYYNLLVLTLFIFSCQKDKDIKVETFLNQNQIGYYTQGSKLVYNQTNCQLSANIIRQNFRIQNDSQQEFVNIKLEKLGPDNILSQISYCLNNYYQEKELSLTIIKQNQEFIWLWDNNSKIGIILPYYFYK